MRLVVIIPALNEAKTIGAVIDAVPRVLAGVDEVRVVVVDDGSTDDTARLATAAGAEVVRHPVNLGVGAAFATGIRSALSRGADLIVNMDGDGQFNPADIAELVRPVVAGEAGFVTCTRFAHPDYQPTMPGVKRLGNRGMAWIVSTLTGQRFSDVACGFRCYSRETAQRLHLFGRFTYTQESFVSLASQGVAMREVPLVVRGVREHGHSRVARNVVQYGFRALSILLRALRDHRPLAFFGSIGAGVFGCGLVLGAAVFVHWVRTGQTSPYRSVLLGSAAGLIVGVLLGVMALLADMLGRVRRTNETLLFELRRLADRLDAADPTRSPRDP